MGRIRRDVPLPWPALQAEGTSRVRDGHLKRHAPLQALQLIPSTLTNQDPTDRGSEYRQGDHPSRGEDVRMGSRRFQERFGSCSLYSRPCRKSRDRLVGCAPARPPAPCSPPSSWLGPHPFTRTHRPLRCPDLLL